MNLFTNHHDISLLLTSVRRAKVVKWEEILHSVVVLVLGDFHLGRRRLALVEEDQLRVAEAALEPHLALVASEPAPLANVDCGDAVRSEKKKRGEETDE